MTCWGWRFRWRQYGWNLDDGRRSRSVVKMSKGLQDLIVKMHRIRIFWVRRTAMQQALTIWSTPRQVLAKDPAQQFRYLARPQNPRSMNSSSISEHCVVNGDAATRNRSWPMVQSLVGISHGWNPSFLSPLQCANRRSEEFRSVGVFLKVMSRWKDSSIILGRQGTQDPWCQKRKVRYGIKKKWSPSTSNIRCVTPGRQPESQHNQSAIAAIW